MNQGSITQGTLHGALKMCLENENWALKSVKSANYILLDIKKPNLDFDPGGHSIVKNTGGGGRLDSLGSGILVGKDILGFFKNIDLVNS